MIKSSALKYSFLPVAGIIALSVILAGNSKTKDLCRRMEMPHCSDKDVILEYEGFTVCYDSQRLIPRWVAYELTEEESYGTIDRSGSFGMDMSYRGRQAMREDYSHSGWDKGHMAPAGDMKWSEKAMRQSFYLTNVCPQNHNLNCNGWQTLEKRCRAWARKYGRIWIVCGPVIRGNRFGTIGDRQVTVPDAFFKAVLYRKGGTFSSIAFIFKNDSSDQSVNKCALSVDEIEAQLGLNLFRNAPESAESSTDMP